MSDDRIRLSINAKEFRDKAEEIIRKAVRDTVSRMDGECPICGGNRFNNERRCKDCGQ